jgi:hypothetical protein
MQFTAKRDSENIIDYQSERFKRFLKYVRKLRIQFYLQYATLFGISKTMPLLLVINSP